MSSLFGRIRLKGNQCKYRHILTTPETIYKYIDFTAVEKYPFNPDTILDEGCWYYIDNITSSRHCIDILTKEFSDADYDNLNVEDVEKLDYLFSASTDGSEIFFQKINKAAVVEKKTILLFGTRFEYLPHCAPIVINTEPDAVYVKNCDTLFFKKLTSLKGIFPGIEELYNEATHEETKEFLEMGCFLLDGLEVEKVNTLNRRRITSAKKTLEILEEDQREALARYILDYCPDLADQEGHFLIHDNDDLAKVLFGIDQRFYTTMVGGERRLANSIKPI